MDERLSEYRIVRALAETACQRVARKTIRALQRLDDPSCLLSGEDTSLGNVWDEICVQLQAEYSSAWDAYEETVRSFVDNYVDELPAEEREAIWLQTPEGQDWDDEPEDEREPYPVFNSDIANHIVNDYVLSCGSDWSNPLIRAYLER